MVFPMVWHIVNLELVFSVNMGTCLLWLVNCTRGRGQRVERYKP